LPKTWFLARTIKKVFTATRIMQLFHHLLSVAQFKIKIPTPQEAWPLV